MIEEGKLSEFMNACRREIAGELRDDRYSRMFYSTDASLYQVIPHAVLIPRAGDDVVAAVSLAAEHGVPVLARAAGTSLAGQAVNEALVIDFSRHLDAIVEINAAERWARVQPGVVVDDLNGALRPHGLQFGPDPASSDRSTIGGAVANNATGSHSLRYGMTADHVRAMTVVLADGSVATLDERPTALASSAHFRIAEELERLTAVPANRVTIREGTPRYWRRCGGYNLDRLLDAAGQERPLAQLICGSEGTLAVMTEITVNLVPRPNHTGLVLLEFADAHAALAAVPAILESDPAAVELLDPLSLTLCRDVPAYARLLASVVSGRPQALLVVEFTGESEAAVLAAIERFERRARGGEAGQTVGVTRAIAPEAQAAVWAVRKVGLGLLMSMKGDMKPVPFIEDAAVPVAHLAEYVRQIEGYCAGLDTPISYYAHAGAGCLHIRPLINRRSAEQVGRLPDIGRFAAGLVRGYGGALSSEHGDGRSRSWLNEAFYGPALYGLFRRVKQIFDPGNILNPGNIVDAGPMTANLRRLTAAPPPHLNFSDYESESSEELLRIVNFSRPQSSLQPDQNSPLHPQSPPATGLSRAIEMCNGAGVCRKRASGTMCPSFMVTREEEHSTRGRLNALRAAMSGVLPAEELTSRRMYEVMELCISCKACKAECPSSVDMARLKTEFLARYQEANGTPLRARFFGHSAALNRLGSGAAAVVSGPLLRSRAGLGLLAAALGLARQRPLPTPARVPFETWWRRRGGSAQGHSYWAEIILLVDPFTNYNYPEVGIAAVELLEALGARVRHAVAVDEGRAFFSKGLVREARRVAGRVVAALAGLDGRDLPIVGLEPSSLLMLRDEYLYLLPDEPAAGDIATRSRTFEEYLAELAAVRDLRSYFSDRPRQVLLHGHCHQKALVGTGPARLALALPANYAVEEVDSGCCGMAGSFGYEAEHYTVSMQMAERRLLPAVRAAAPETIVAAAGVSCREQIRHGSGREALHPAQILRDALAS